MILFPQPSSAARTALIYITVGALLVIWTGIWFVYLRNNPPETSQPHYWCAGFLVSGLVLVLIGLGVGQIGRSARQAEHPPQVVTPPGVNAEPNVGVPTTAPAAPLAQAVAVTPPEAVLVPESGAAFPNKRN